MFRYLATVLTEDTKNRAAGRPRRLDVRVDGPICRELCPPVAVCGRRVRVVRAGRPGAFPKGGRLVLRPAEAERLLRRAGHDPRGVQLRSAFLEARAMPHLGGRLASLALRGGRESVLDLRPLAATEGLAFEPGGLYDALADWREPVSSWASRYRLVRRGAGDVVVHGGAEGVRFRRRMQLVRDAPVALVEVTLHSEAGKGKRNGKEKATGRPPRRAPAARPLSYAACLALAVPPAGLRLGLPDGERCEEWRALADPAVLHPFQSGDRIEPRLKAGAFASAADGYGGTLVLFDPDAAARVELVGQRHRVRVRLRFPPRRAADGPIGVALVPCERVAASPYGVAGVAATPPDPRGRVRVSALVREPCAGQGDVTAKVAGREVALAPRALGAAGWVHAGSVRLAADVWRRFSQVVVTTTRGRYKL